MGVAIRIRFEHGFIDYLNAQTSVGASQLTRKLEQAYGQHQTWDFLRDDPGAWYALIQNIPMNPNPENPRPRRADRRGPPPTEAVRGNGAPPGGFGGAPQPDEVRDNGAPPRALGGSLQGPKLGGPPFGGRPGPDAACRRVRRMKMD